MLQACIMLLIAHLEGVENSWLSSVSWEDFTTVGPAYQWYAAVYWVITTVSAASNISNDTTDAAAATPTPQHCYLVCISASS
jgi:hypothetical protein